MSQSLLRNIVPRIDKIYDEFEDLLKSKPEKNHRRISNNLAIPNIIRTTDLEIEIYIERLFSATTKTVKDLTANLPSQAVELHIITESIIIFGKDRTQKDKLEKHSTWWITEKDLELFIRAVDKPAIVALEYKKKPLMNYNPKKCDNIGSLEGSCYTPSEEDFSQRRSFIRKKVDGNSINDHILFLDAEFTSQMADKSKAPISVTILNGYGKVIVDTFITPRHRILKIGDQTHGIQEKQLRNQMDEYEMLKKIRQMCRGKILIGHDLQMELNHLCIEKYSLLGIRDLAGTKTFRKFEIYPKSGGQFYKLKTLASVLLQKDIQQPGKHNSYEDVHAIMEIYRQIESSYEDDIPCNQEDLRWKIPKVINEDECVQAKKIKLNPTPIIRKQPIDNVIEAWQKEVVDLDADEIFTFQPDVSDGVPLAVIQSTSVELIPSTPSQIVENIGIDPEFNRKNKIYKPVCSIQHLEHVDIPPEPRNNIVPELQVLGETFRTAVSEIEYVSENGHVLNWKI